MKHTVVCCLLYVGGVVYSVGRFSVNNGGSRWVTILGVDPIKHATIKSRGNYIVLIFDVWGHQEGLGLCARLDQSER